eukprot:COSAG06_NODE_7100_length_2634_cov_107.897830_3_plen_113_part_00
MHIRECGCDEKIVLSKFKFNCDEVDKSIPDPLPQNLNHFLLIVGKPGSSKTTLLLNMICKRGKMYNNVKVMSFDTVGEVSYVVGMPTKTVYNYFHRLIRPRGPLCYVSLFKD